MTKVIFIVEDKARWNTLVESQSEFALMQSFEWGEFKENLGWKAFRIAVDEDDRIIAGAQVLVRQLPLQFASIAYILHAGRWSIGATRKW